MLGGMIGAMMPPAAMRPVERLRLYPALTIIGMRMAPSAAVSATAEPDRPANRTVAIVSSLDHHRDENGAERCRVSYC